MYTNNFSELYHGDTDCEFLCHFGVRDMHWGVRRWQNPDGSLTPEGRIHYGVKGTRNRAKAKEIAKEYNKEGKYAHLYSSSSSPFRSEKYYVEEYKGDPNNLKNKRVQDDIIAEYNPKKEPKQTVEQITKQIKENFERDGFKARIEPLNDDKVYTFIRKNVYNRATGDVKIGLDTMNYSKENADKLINDAKQVEKILPKINRVATKHINDYFRDRQLDLDWNDGQDPSGITKDVLNSVYIRDNGKIELWYNDGKKRKDNYYGGHSISVDYLLKDLLNDDNPYYYYEPTLNG